MKKNRRHTPKNYDGTGKTSHRIGDVIPAVLRSIGAVYSTRPDLVLAAWPQVVGPRVAPMTEAVRFSDGILTVKVKNSTLHSLLSQHDKGRILKSLREKFPRTPIHNVVFKMG